MLPIGSPSKISGHDAVSIRGRVLVLENAIMIGMGVALLWSTTVADTATLREQEVVLHPQRIEQQFITGDRE
ncbi:MAG: hypothetical protein AAFV85_28195 [Cyanobacteria bacterium J06634_6]